MKAIAELLIIGSVIMAMALPWEVFLIPMLLGGFIFTTSGMSQADRDKEFQSRKGDLVIVRITTTIHRFETNRKVSYNVQKCVKWYLAMVEHARKDGEIVSVKLYPAAIPIKVNNELSIQKWLLDIDQRRNEKLLTAYKRQGFGYHLSNIVDQHDVSDLIDSIIESD